MMQKRTSFMGIVLALVVLLVGTSSVFAQDAACTDCHNDTTVITGKQFAWEESLHGTGHSAAYAGGRGSCTACHSGASFSAMVAAGQNPSEFRTVVDVTRQDCRACHQIHTSNTAEDWALTCAPTATSRAG
ncbi:MAG: cytochrome c3 family protein [Planctomycetota bacterium]